MRNKHNILAVITARGGSKGIPGKNIKKLGGKPLIAYSIDVVRKSRLVTHSIVSTDDEGIADVAKQYDAEVPFMRPKELARDATPHLPVMQHALSFMEEKLGVRFDIAVVFQPTSPFRTAEDIDGTIQTLIDSDADSSVSVCEWTETHPLKAKKFSGDRLVPYCEAETSTRRQELETAYKRSGAVYAIRRDVLVAGEDPSDLYGRKTVGYVVPSDRSIDIDTPFDWVKAEWMLTDLRQRGFEF